MRGARCEYLQYINALIIRKGGTQPKFMRAGKKMLPTSDPVRPNIMLSETIMVLKET